MVGWFDFVRLCFDYVWVLLRFAGRSVVVVYGWLFVCFDDCLLLG